MPTSTITKEQLDTSMTYTFYRDMTDRLLAEQKTTGTNHAPEMVAYTRMNAQRMRRVEKTTVLDDEMVELLLSVNTKMIWVILTEAWCGDAAQIVPALAKFADASPLIELKLLLRDEHLELMDQYLTNGGRSIPKLICLKADTGEVLGDWGPRPVPAQELVNQAKADNLPFPEMAEKLHGWYAKDRSRTLQEEFKVLLRNWSELVDPRHQDAEHLS